MSGFASRVAAAQAVLDAEVTAALADCRQNGVAIHCRRGCGNCCRLAVHATWPEAARLATCLDSRLQERLRAHVARLRPLAEGCSGLKEYLQRYRSQLEGCPFLDADGACAVYAFRPLACRALLSTRPGDWCGIDLSTLSGIDRQLYLASLDPSRVDYPTHYLSRTRSRGEALEGELLAAMREAHGVAVDGNLALLTWLAGEGLPAAVEAGGEAVEALLQELALPAWLVRCAVV